MSTSSRSRTEAWVIEIQTSQQSAATKKRARSLSPPSHNKRRTIGTPPPPKSTVSTPAGQLANFSTHGMSQAPKHDLLPSPTNSRASKALKPDDSASNKEAPSTPTSKVTKKSDGCTTNNRAERAALAKGMMVFQVQEAFESYPDFQKRARSVLAERGSAMTCQSTKAIREYQFTHATDNEDTYLSGLKPLYIKDSRTVPVKNSDGIIEDVVRFFADDRLVQARKSNFVKGVLPTDLKNSAMKDPVPDFVFGIKAPNNYANPLRVSEYADQLINVSSSVPHCFFAIEGKGADLPIADAETQAIRAGAVLVYARRLLMERAGLLGSDPPNGPDLDSFVYTCAWAPGLAIVFVNWCEVREKKAVYHMNWLNSYALHTDDGMKGFRATIHSILDWGLGSERLLKIDEMLQKVVEKGK
ncbi:MAG: hypothetical protein Q9172_005157 [Xanthocarpia lactea]